jgi:hypothetical protein
MLDSKTQKSIEESETYNLIFMFESFLCKKIVELDEKEIYTFISIKAELKRRSLH